MTSRFLEFMPFIFEWEGGYDNDPDDPGGETKYGIDKRSHPHEDIKNLTKERASEIYFESYWTRNRCDELPPLVGEVIMNIAVNCGSARAGRWLQTLVGAKPDGTIGSKTVEATNNYINSNHSARSLAVNLIGRTTAHYHSIANGKLRKFLKGWLNRNRALDHWIATH